MRRAGWAACTALCLTLGLGAAPPALAADTASSFLEFPMVTKTVAAEKAPAFAWLIHQGDQTRLMFASAPDFKRVQLAQRDDHDGKPISDVALSPDGKWVVFMTAEPAGGEKSYNPAGLIEAPKPMLWLVSTSGGEAREVGPGLGPVFSPDGRQLIWRHAGDLHALDLTDPAAKEKTLVAGGAGFGDLTWSRDGQQMIFVSGRGGYDFIGAYKPGADRIDWLVTGADRLSSPQVSPDGTRVAYLRLPGREHTKVYDYTETEPLAVEVLDLASGKTRTLWESKGKASGSAEDGDSPLRWVGDDRIVFLSEQDGWNRLYAIPAAGGQPTPITPTGCEAAESEAAGGASLVVLHNCKDIETRQMSVIDARSGAETAVASKDLVLADAAASSGYLAFAGATADAPALVRIMDLKTRKLVMSESPADYGWKAEFKSPAPRSVTYQAADGFTVHAQLFEPAGKGPHPALVYVHGGPSRQMFAAFSYMGYYANDFAANRALADRGYVVLSVNYRSGIGYGRDYREAPDRGWRGASEYRDVLAGGRFLQARPEVDPQRIGIWGGSYGGLLTGQALARNSDVFKAGVAIHGVYDWSWPSAKPGHLNPAGFFGVSPTDEAQKAVAFKSSPLGAGDGWRSPVLIFHGDQDMNVDVLESVDLARKLRDRGVEVKTVILPGEAHDFVRHSSWTRLWDEESAFFDEKLAGGR
jgi:dipeptidyl aminopeptidase/acylaminoacyl peptidase